MAAEDMHEPTTSLTKEVFENERMFPICVISQFVRGRQGESERRETQRLRGEGKRERESMFLIITGKYLLKKIRKYIRSSQNNYLIVRTESHLITCNSTFIHVTFCLTKSILV